MKDIIINYLKVDRTMLDPLNFAPENHVSFTLCDNRTSLLGDPPKELTKEFFEEFGREIWTKIQEGRKSSCKN